MKIIFISDLHLSPLTSDKNHLFFSLMESWMTNIDALYILGDFFDYYLGDDDINPFNTSIKACFKKFTQQTPIYFMGGNHDFGIGKRFAKDTGIQLLKEFHLVKVMGKRILLNHGDSFCTLDVKYQKMKKILQNPILMFIMRKIPLSWRYKIKDKLEQKSNDSYNPKHANIYNVVNQTIAIHAKKFDANTIIHGHTHNPGHYEIALENNIKIPRIEIPDWTGKKFGGYVMFDNGQFTIQNYNGNQAQ